MISDSGGRNGGARLCWKESPMKKTYPKTPRPLTKGNISVAAARKAFAAIARKPGKPDKAVLYDTKVIRIVGFG